MDAGVGADKPARKRFCDDADPDAGARRVAACPFLLVGEAQGVLAVTARGSVFPAALATAAAISVLGGRVLPVFAVSGYRPATNSGCPTLPVGEGGWLG